MGKKTVKQTQSLTTTESLKRHSNTLERHIFHRQRSIIKETLQKNTFNISAFTQILTNDLLHQAHQQSKLRKQNKFDQSNADSQEIRQQIRQKERLHSAFQQKLIDSQTSYQKTSLIFKAQPLKQKYRHLLQLDHESQQQKIDCDAKELEQGEICALTKIKQIYKRFRVSNMYRRHLIQKISKKYLQKLIQKGYLRQQKNIISLIS